MDPAGSQEPRKHTRSSQATKAHKREKVRRKRSPIQTGRCLFAVASFMLALLALISLKKSRSFQKPNRIARTFDVFGGRRATKQGVSGPAPEWRGVSRMCGSSGTAPEPVWGPRVWDKFLVNFFLQIWITDFDREIYSYITVPRFGRPDLSYR